jgi:hypothetical protein
MLAGVRRLASEHPNLDGGLVRAIYQHQVLTTGQQPTLLQARQYIAHLTARLDDATVRVTLGLPPPSNAILQTPPGFSGVRPTAGRSRRTLTLRSRRTSRCSTARSGPRLTTCGSSLSGSAAARLASGTLDRRMDGRREFRPVRDELHQGAYPGR